MPALSPTMTFGKVKQWNKKEGDKLSPGDVLCEIETDKASVGFEIQDSGYLAKIINPTPGVEMNVGDILAVTVDE
jgi:pyruvate dehydrogenase E2 component (dihydrolipoamide acetyltransferase)